MLGLALLAAFGYGAIACSSDSGHGPPVGAPTGPVVTTEGGGAGGGANIGQAAATNGGDTNTSNAAGSFNAAGGLGSGFSDPSAGSPGLGSPGTAGGTSVPPFGAGGGTSTFGGSSF